MQRISFEVSGSVQGVGFRPFVAKLAQNLSLCGFVKNTHKSVLIELQGDEEKLLVFEEKLQKELPPLAKIQTLIKTYRTPSLDEKSFEIVQSSCDTKNKTLLPLPLDVATCENCLEDIQKEGKYHHYFATSCSDCGGRFSLMERFAFDRENTSMKEFGMCSSCKEEYTQSDARRYHAQTIACKECGPQLRLYDAKKQKDLQVENIFAHTAKLIQEGNIVAIKGVGGFHLVCDSTNDEVIQRLREAKRRKRKPFALMCKDINEVRRFACVDSDAKQALRSKEAPIVLLEKSKDYTLGLGVAPGINKVGVMLAHTPLHHLLLRYLDAAIIATSANLEGEPLLIEFEELHNKLGFVDFILDHDRKILHRIDDSIIQIVSNKTQILRHGRGYAPQLLTLTQSSGKNILALGGHTKSTIALCVDNKVILSPHLGDMQTLQSQKHFEETIAYLCAFYDFDADLLVCDKHPNYFTSLWAKKQNKPLLQVQHHLAHIWAAKAEFGLDGDYLGCSFDGTGYGEDGMLWGGEIFVGERRKYHLKPIKLLGGEKAIQEPRRIALSLLFEHLSLAEVMALELGCVKSFTSQELQLLYTSFTKGINTPQSSSVGRLFDAVASLCSLVDVSDYEGESGLVCEKYYDSKIQECFDYSIDDGIIEIKIIEYFLHNKVNPEHFVSLFLNTLASIVVSIAQKEALDVILTGGVFQNKTLLELVIARLDAKNITSYFQQKTPINDGGIALGQIYYALNSLE
ncbi:MAG: carbamoyltransferase HypF [Sulfurimonas sp.]|jgi:hydrogenase maturation protein HypF|nr:carbamoyltransferase HypF [Sulfurimonas sp.]